MVLVEGKADPQHPGPGQNHQQSQHRTKGGLESSEVHLGLMSWLYFKPLLDRNGQLGSQRTQVVFQDGVPAGVAQSSQFLKQPGPRQLGVSHHPAPQVFLVRVQLGTSGLPGAILGLGFALRNVAMHGAAANAQLGCDGGLG